MVNIHLCWLSLSFGNRSGIKTPALWFWGKPLRNSLRHKRVKKGHWKYCLTIYRWHGLSHLQACTTVYRNIHVWAAETGALQCLLRTDCCRKKKRQSWENIKRNALPSCDSGGSSLRALSLALCPKLSLLFCVPLCKNQPCGRRALSARCHCHGNWHQTSFTHQAWLAMDGGQATDGLLTDGGRALASALGCPGVFCKPS